MKSFVPVALQRVRVRLSRRGPGAQLSHLQQIEAIRRALKNAAWPVATSQGKKPVMKISFGPAISVGYESLSEYCDVQLSSRMDLVKAKAELGPHLPEGYAVLDIKSIPRFFPSLEIVTNVIGYEISSPLLEGTGKKWEDFWSKTSVFVTKKKQDRDVVIDARACVLLWQLEGSRLTLQLRIGAGKTLKPEKIIQEVCGLPDAVIVVGTPTCELAVTRTHLYFEKDSGQLVEP